MRLFRRRNKRTSRTQKRAATPKVVLIRQIVLGVFLLLLVTGLGAGVWYGSRVEALTITEVEIIGGTTVPHDSVRSIVETELAGEYYHLVPKRFAWLYPEDRILEEILAIDRIKNVALERSSGTKLIVVFEEHVPYALWCQVEATECIFLDRQGYAFAKAPKLAGGAFLRFSRHDQDPAVGEMAFPAEFVQSTTEFIDDVYEQLGLNIISVRLIAEEELLYQISGGGQLKVSERLTHEETLENLVTLLTSEAFSHIEPGNFQYIDLRYGNKVFVNEELAPADASVASSTATSTP